ncbi:MAG: hypothetical protein LUC60_02745 [Lachnospiraceae bacterium]|nr:hypothetical protein [Lachnospiraceae bacterium]
MNFFRRLFFLWKKEEPESGKADDLRRTFFEYREKAPEVLCYLRRERKIARRDLELIVIDNEEEPAWQVCHVLQRLLPEMKLLTIVTGRQEYFSRLARDAFEEYGLLVAMTAGYGEKPAGNLVLDLRDWEKQLTMLGDMSTEQRVGKDQFSEA